MAGTRLLLSIVFLIEIPLLIIIAIWSAVNSSKDKAAKWHPDHQPFLANRRGLGTLQQKYDFLKRMAEFKETNTFLWRPSLNVDVFMYWDDPSAKDMVFQTLKQSIHERLIQSQSLSDIEVAVSSVNVGHERESDSLDLLVGSICRTGHSPSALETSLTKNPHELLQVAVSSSSSQYDALGYIPVIVASGCRESNVYISETGSIMVTFQSNLSRDDIFHLLKTRVSEEIRRQISMSYDTLNQILKQPSPSMTACSKVVLSLVDPDPQSHAAVPYQNAIEHGQRLNRALVNVTKEYIIPLMDKLSEYSNMTLYTQILPYHGLDVLSHVRKNEYMDDTVDYTITTMDARKVFLSGDLAHFMQGFVSPYVEEEPSDDGCGNVIQIVLYVAQGDMRPMYVLEEGIDNRWSTAFALPDKNVAISIMNLAHDMDWNHHDFVDNKNVTDGSKEMSSNWLHEQLDDLYQSQTQSSVAYLASYMRQSLGLLSPQPYLLMDTTSSDSTEKVLLPVYRERPKNGVAKWEVDLLIRNAIPFKIRHILNSLENVNDLIQMRRGISVSEEVSANENINVDSC